jgi:hypothetical protein
LAFFRFSRDKRGYEHFSLVQPTTNRRGKVRQRVLYWFRTPPNVRVGREPFDEAVRRQLEAQNPDVTFDWPQILEAPIPSADADKWRDRRRVERAARHAAAVEDEPAETIAGDVKRDAEDPALQPTASLEPRGALTAEPGSADGVAAASSPLAPGAADASRKRRRRRRGRRGEPQAQPGQPTELRAPDGPRDPIEPGDSGEPADPSESGEPEGD